MRAARGSLFSVIIPTRNRSASFAAALRSVLDQRFGDFEIIVVNDGSSEEHERRYGEVIAGACGRARMLNLMRTGRGHGPGHARNCGAAEARGDFFGFLDDDDQWTDPEHLGRVARVIAANAQPIDLILSNQRAFRNGVPVPEVIWIEDLGERVRGSSDAGGAYTVTTAELLRCPAHCHLNTTIVSRRLFDEIGGLDEGLLYEEDRDFYLRAIDRAELIKFLPAFVSRHNIPDPTARMDLNPIQSELAKRLAQLRVFDKAILFSTRPELRHYAMRQRAYILQHIAAEAARIDLLDAAVYYARQVLAIRPTPSWLGAATLFWLCRRLPVFRSRCRRSPGSVRAGLGPGENTDPEAQGEPRR